jgi:hypothetical protein
MKLLCAWRPVDPGVEAHVPDSNGPPLLGWTFVDLSAEVANQLLDRYSIFERLKTEMPDLTNIAIDLPKQGRFALVMLQRSDDLEALWTENRIGETKFAELPEAATAESLNGELCDMEHVLVDIVLEAKGVWFQIFPPQTQFTMETAVMDRQMLQRAAGVPDSD